jgi:hypothetical protein
LRSRFFGFSSRENRPKGAQLSLRHNGFRHDWPHPVSVVQPPNDADLLELFYRYAPDEAERAADTGGQSGEAVRVSGLE